MTLTHSKKETSTLIKVRTQYDRRLVDFALKSQSNSRKKTPQINEWTFRILRSDG